MEECAFRLLLPSNRSIATVLAAEEDDGWWTGKLDWIDPPPNIRRAFDEWEELVNDQILSLLEAAEQKISAFHIRAIRANDSAEFRMPDIQIYPAEGFVRFRLGDRLDSPQFGPQGDDLE